MEGGGSQIGVWIAYGAICAFWIVVLLLVVRSLLLSSTLWILPIGRLLVLLPGGRALLARMERRAVERLEESGFGDRR